ncbi:MAG: hypothetical protein GX339_05195 [Tissierellia bacterium]|nr:hypothetical protein [Tissierellia bacterium]
MDNIVLKIPKKSEYMSTVRLTSSAIVNMSSFNVDEIQDIKVIISEICTFFIKNIEKYTESLEITYEIHKDKVIVEVTDLNEGQLPAINELQNDMSIMIIESLADNYTFDSENKKIIFEKIKK